MVRVNIYESKIKKMFSFCWFFCKNLLSVDSRPQISTTEVTLIYNIQYIHPVCTNHPRFNGAIYLEKKRHYLAARILIIFCKHILSKGFWIAYFNFALLYYISNLIWLKPTHGSDWSSFCRTIKIWWGVILLKYIPT